MSLIKGKQEFRTILDFSKDKLSKNMIKQALRGVEVHEVSFLPESNTYTFVENEIRVGMYTIRLLFSSVSAETRTQLKEYGGFRVAIYEHKNKSLKNINLDKCKLFKGQYWLSLNDGYDIRMNNLTDIIMHLKRLDNLKIFS